MKPTPLPNKSVRRRLRVGRAGRVLLWVCGIVLAPLLLLYLVLLVMPIPLPFMREQTRSAVMAVLPQSADLQLGSMSLALENGSWPVLQFTPVVYTDSKTGGKIEMQALDVGFSPFRALVGQPGASITMVAPHLEVNQDLLGPRLANFQVIEDPKGGPPIVRVQEGQDAFPSVGISSSGLSVHGSMPNGAKPDLRSDNDWLIYNLEATEQSLGQIVAQARQGRFSRLVIKNGVMDMNDAVYGVFREFTGIDLDVAPGLDGKTIKGRFSATFAGQTMQGDVTRKVAADGAVHLSANVTNIDFSSFMPFLNDTDSVIGVTGTGALSIDVDFDKAGKATGGVFHTDMTGMDLRVNDDKFPIVSSIAAINWVPDKGQFTLAGTDIRIGRSAAHVSGIFVLGLDDRFGPTVGISVRASKVALYPNDMAAPASDFDEVDFSGWSAPLYGALGVDSLKATKPGAEIDTKGRIDMLRKGMGMNLEVTGFGVSADDVKRIWPYFLSTESRDWFVKNVTAGKIESADLKFSFPIGTLATRSGDDRPLPPGSLAIDLVGTGVKVTAVDSLAPVTLDGKTTLQIRDAKLTVSGEGAAIPTDKGAITLATPALVIDSSNPAQHTFEVSGEVKSGIPALVALARQQQPQLLAKAKLPIDPGALDGKVDLNLVSNITVDKAGAIKGFDYAANGAIADFASSAPIEGHAISSGQISFTASQKGYQATGTAKVDGVSADLKLDGTPDTPEPELLLSSTLDTKDLKSMGFDVSNFLSGEVRFVAKPLPDGSVQMAVDIGNAALNIADLGISKAKGVPGTLQAEIKQDGTLTKLTQVKLTFGSVDLEGSIDYDDKKGFQSAQFSTFALSQGDKAQLSLTPTSNGYALRLAGEQLDLKPMLRHFFGLGGGTGGPQSTLVPQTITLDLNLKRALGFYETTAYNMQVDLELRGTDIERADVQGQFGNGKSVSVTTNTTSTGKIMSVAFNDFGTLLRFGGIYERIEGGSGSLVMTSLKGKQADQGNFEVHNFALVNEANVAQILSQHAQSRQLLAHANKLSFTSGRVQFVRQPDRIEVKDGLLAGDTVGGTIRGFIYTQRRQYDLVGTYVPLFGLNSIFQKLPIFGPLLGGREGEGLIGVTFAVRGSLDHPNFQINPASILLPGAFRELFEYRARGLPEEPASGSSSGSGK